ncbi:MAG: hypothetical protein JWR26_2776 [Pedosphaera sp.]|nr:hypothetical protein [Pedosphaera sp.]
MKKLLFNLGAAGVALWAQSAGAFTYSDNDLLLVFREPGFNDVEFNLGPVSNYLGKPNGSVTTVTNFNATTVSNNFGGLSGVEFLLMSASSPYGSQQVYITDADSTVPQILDLQSGTWKNLQNHIAAVGVQAATATSHNLNQTYIISSAAASSYSYIASSGGQSDITTISGAAASGTSPVPTSFVVENTIPSTGSAISKFFRLQGTATPPPGNPSLQIGTFAMTSDGTITFTAGGSVVLTPPTGLSIVRNGNVNTVSFNSVSGVNYRLLYTTDLAANPSVSTWTTLPSVAGNGSAMTLQDTSSDTARYYKVQAF